MLQPPAAVSAVLSITLHFLSQASAAEPPKGMQALIEADYLRQAETFAQPSRGVFPTAYFFERGRLLAADVKRAGVDTATFERELDAAAAELAKLPAGSSADAQRALYLRVRRTVRRLAFANPRLDFDKLLVCKRFTQNIPPAPVFRFVAQPCRNRLECSAEPNEEPST
jgi:hypothetical protein